MTSTFIRMSCKRVLGHDTFVVAIKRSTEVASKSCGQIALIDLFILS